MKKIDLLRALQEIDSSLDQVRRELDECRARLGDDSELQPLREAAETARTTLLELQSKGRDLDRAIELRRVKLKGEEKKLYDGSVKIPKELSQLAREVDLEKAQVSAIEDEALANMEALDAAAAADAEASRQLAEREDAWKAVQEALQAQCSELERREAMLAARRDEAAAQVDAATLRTYDAVRRMRAGLAVAAIERGTCQGCRISLSSSLIQRARSSADLVPCQSCGRFLYVP